MLFYHIKQFYFFFIIIVIAIVISPIESKAQEKANFLEHRFDGYYEIITNKSTPKNLKDIQHKLKKQGIQFTFHNLTYNKKKEIIRISIHLKNKRSEFSSKWNQKNIPIPTIKIVEINGIVSITTNIKLPDSKLLNN
jgi:uncharacterized membrane protein YhiD involved in acid resistance